MDLFTFHLFSQIFPLNHSSCQSLARNVLRQGRDCRIYLFLFFNSFLHFSYHSASLSQACTLWWANFLNFI